MSIESATAFREYVTTNPDAQAEVKAAITGGGDLSAVGAKHGFEFSKEDAQAVMNQTNESGEMSEFELDMVAGGGADDEAIWS